ncbi:formyltransferase family protein [Natrarchaeobaculum aegyptiacum]|uniref:Methionyl-tRNA formyltransferase n=1 Tax=Natrarchaeobaculum aegyptiacum TaxID=745377 RepID=A0A2Z2HTC6_9EURY|nr:formyltransferase family protein [Natrarchaeobaculum aegyptiacum]ARS90450.1 methionyl-tRNA formyltransferase [Natrarchaeobaculum aegyptiacum]
MDGSDQVRVGILAEPWLYEWQVRALETLRDDPHVDLAIVVRNDGTREYQAESWNRKSRITLDDVREFLALLETEKAWTLVLAERAVARILGDEQTLWHRHSVENVECLRDVDIVGCTPHTDGSWNELPAPAVDLLAERCDVVVRFGFGLVRGDVLTAPEHGVISFHPADIRRYRGMGPPAIFHDGRGRAGTTLQRLNESIDGGEIVAFEEVSLEGCYTLWDVFDRLATLQIDLLGEGLANLRDPTFEPTAVPEEQLGAFYYRDQRRQPAFAARVLAKNLSGRLRRRLERGGTDPADRAVTELEVERSGRQPPRRSADDD